jgi:hypothetical protein
MLLYDKTLGHVLKLKKNEMLVDVQKIVNFYFPTFFYPFVFNIWNYELHARCFFNINKSVFFSKKKNNKNLPFKNTILF